jgi:hypothetical protein
MILCNYGFLIPQEYRLYIWRITDQAIPKQNIWKNYPHYDIKTENVQNDLTTSWTW